MPLRRPAPANGSCGCLGEQKTGPALKLSPDLATVMAGMNDLIRPGFNAAEVTGNLDEMFTAMTVGAHVATITPAAPAG
jgi:lysophospholipase L1-like esterase